MFHNAPRPLERGLSTTSTLTTATPSLASTPSPILPPMLSPDAFSRADSPALSDDSASSLGLNDFSLDNDAFYARDGTEDDFAQEAVSPAPDAAAHNDVLDFFDFGKDDGSALAPNGSSDLVYNDALAQLVAGYGFGSAATAVPPAGMQMLFSPSNTDLVVNQAIVPSQNVNLSTRQQQEQHEQGTEPNVSTAHLLSALTSAAVAAVSQGNLPQTASPAQLLNASQELFDTSSVCIATEPRLTVSAVEEDINEKATQGMQAPPTVPKERKKRKRITDTSKLLPLDAPVQAKNYHGPSATARKPLPTEIFDGEEDDDDDSAESTGEYKRSKRSPSVSTPAPAFFDDETLTAAEIQHQKRLQNTLAARRSRHRKAEELRQLHETIEVLQKQAQEWKRKAEGMREENERLKKEMGIA